MTIDRAKLIKDFWEAPNEAFFDQKTVAAVACRSTYWCEKLRCEGGGIPFSKNRKKCLYRKVDIIEWLDQFKVVKSTSEYGNSHI